VVGLAQNRLLSTALSRAEEIANADAASWEEKYSRVTPFLRAAMDCTVETKIRNLADYVEEAKKAVTATQKHGIHGPFPGWVRLAGAMMPGELVVLAARPGLGKTALALQFAADTARKGATVAFFSLEMTGMEVALRLATQHAGVPLHGPKEHVTALEGIHGLAARLHVYESTDAGTMEKIEARCRLLHAGKDGLGLVVIDYLQLITPPPESRRDHRERQVADMSRQLKLLAQSLGCPVMLLAQLNRESEKAGRRPQLADLRESGSIEQDADRVWFLYQPPPPSNQPLDQAADRITVEVIQAKARNGPPWVVGDLIFYRPAVTFTPAANPQC
jgi:replicative DNA helicase